MTKSEAKDITNPLVSCLWVVFDRMNMLNWMLGYLKSQLDIFRLEASQVLERRKSHQRQDKVPALAGGASLPVSDLTADGGRVLYASGGYGAQGEEYIAFANRLLQRIAALMVAQGWEAHESFLFNVLATYLQEHEADADAQKLTKYREKKKLRSLTKPEEWGDFVRSAYRGNDNKELLRCLRALAPHLREGETTNNLDIDLVAWYQALAKVRHAVTHSWFKILPGQLRDMSKTDKKVLAVFFPGLEIDEEYELRMGAEEASRVLTILAEHAFLVFKGLSLKAGYDWDVLGKSRRITRAN